MKKRSILFSVLLIVVGTLVSEVNYSAPEFMQVYYDGFSRNYINSKASGRGNTGVAKLENIENVLSNPASFVTDHTELYVEFQVKPEKSEIGHLYDQNYKSTKPFTFVGFGFSLIDNLSSALYYSMHKNIEYDGYKIQVDPATNVQFREPKYTHYSFGFANSYQIADFVLGADLNYNFHNIDDLVINGSLAKIDKLESAFSFNVGGVYHMLDNLNLGLSYHHSSEVEFDTEYWDWETTVPAKLSAGIVYDYNDNISLLFDYERRLNSQMDDSYEDINILKIGYEQGIKYNVFRIGGMYIPSTYSGDVNLPVAELDSDIIPQYPSNYNNGVENILENDQMFITLGYTLNLNEFTFNLGAMQAIASEINTTQISFSIGLNLSDFDITKYSPRSDEE